MRINSILFGIILSFLFTHQAIGQKDLTERLDKYIQAKTNYFNFSGAVLVSKNDSIILQEGYGIADREWNIANTADTKFRIASNTKQFTAVAILQLKEQGKLGLDDKLSKYFSGFPYGDTVTMHMLLTHSSGIQDYYELDQFRNILPLSISKDSMVAMMKRQLFYFLPGKDIGYSNTGYFLLGLIIEKCAGVSYEKYLTDHIFKVAGMGNTGIDRYDTILRKRAKGYLFSPGGPVNAFDENYRPGTLFAVGSIYSTVEDLFKFEKALDGDLILNVASKKKMFTQYGYAIAREKKNEDPANTFPQAIDPYWYHEGYGVQVDTFLTHKRYYTRGYTQGFKSTVYKFADDGICIVVLQNNEEGPDAVAEPLSAMIFGKDVQMPYKHLPIIPDPELFNKYVGTWVGKIYDYDLTFKIFTRDGKLYRGYEGHPDLELIPESGNKFFYSDGQDKQFEFISNGKDEVSQVWFISSGARFLWNKIK
ncbi:MAG: serine hydrolase domain-containing protein [Bacteroidota bacterium]|jgi:CubicO group peptidase (beta-lactamase class C family)